jgi:methylated-DNA-[protein]-cysteine S-methyltransferase
MNAEPTLVHLVTAPPRHLAWCELDSPLGPVLLARTAQGLSGLWLAGQKDHPGRIDAPCDPHDPLLREAARQLAAYWDDPLPGFRLPLALHGTAFQCSVWRALLDVPPGRTRTYRQIAEQIGRPAAVRAVGAAVGRNPVSIIVPCHRILGSDGSLTGYAGGLDRKIDLLGREGVLLA